MYYYLSVLEPWYNQNLYGGCHDIALLYSVYTSLSKLPQSFTSGDDASTAGASNSQTPRKIQGHHHTAYFCCVSCGYLVTFVIRPIIT